MKLDHIDFGTDIVIMGFIMFFQKAASSLGEHFCKYVMTRCVTHETWFIAGYLWVTSRLARQTENVKPSYTPPVPVPRANVSLNLYFIKQKTDIHTDRQKYFIHFETPGVDFLSASDSIS